MDRDRAKEKVEKLMAMAAPDSGASEQEMETALRQAEALMRKHGIEMAELQSRTGEAPAWEWTKVMVPAGTPTQKMRHLPQWFDTLSVQIAEFTDTKVTCCSIKDYGIGVQFAGDVIDVEYAVWLMKHLRDTIRAMGTAYICRGYTDDERVREREVFRRGMSWRLRERMKALRKERNAAMEAVKTATGTALMVIDQKIALRDAEFGKPKYTTVHSSMWDRRAGAAGREAGDKVGFSRPVSATKGRLLK